MMGSSRSRAGQPKGGCVQNWSTLCILFSSSLFSHLSLSVSLSFVRFFLFTHRRKGTEWRPSSPFPRPSVPVPPLSLEWSFRPSFPPSISGTVERMPIRANTRTRSQTSGRRQTRGRARKRACAGKREDALATEHEHERPTERAWLADARVFRKRFFRLRCASGELENGCARDRLLV